MTPHGPRTSCGVLTGPVVGVGYYRRAYSIRPRVEGCGPSENDCSCWASHEMCRDRPTAAGVAKPSATRRSEEWHPPNELSS